jgi:alginate production protein
LAVLLAVDIIAPVNSVAAQQGAREAASRPNFDPGAPPQTRLRLAPYLAFGAKIEFDYEFVRNLDLNDAEDDDLSLLTPEVELAFSFDPTRHLQAFLNFELSQEFALAEPRERERRLRVELKEAFLFLKDLAAGRLALQIGRQRFNDDREWLYDEELDASGCSLAWRILSCSFRSAAMACSERIFWMRRARS